MSVLRYCCFRWLVYVEHLYSSPRGPWLVLWCLYDLFMFRVVLWYLPVSPWPWSYTFACMISVRSNRGRHTPLYAPFTYAHKTISRSSKSKPPENSRMFHLSLATYAMTIIAFEAKARYVHWTSESTHYGHHLRLVVIIQSRAHRTTLYLLMTWLVDQLNAPRGTSSVASHYLTTIVPTYRLVSTLHLHSKIHKIHSYKKQSWWWWCAYHPAI